jgi:hypothetical protein
MWLHGHSVAVVTRPDGRGREIKYFLNWARRRTDQISHVTVDKSTHVDQGDCRVVIYLNDGTEFLAFWQDREVCRRHVSRKPFRGKPLLWFGEAATC